MDKSQSIIIYKQGDTPQIEVRLEEDTVWLTQQLISELFQTTPQNITIHLNNIYKEGELAIRSTCKDFLQVQTEGKRKVERKRKFYNLDAIISVGYRVKSKTATQFRMWATNTLRDHLVNGYTINKNRLAQKNQEVLHLKTGIQILNRMIKEKGETDAKELLNTFAKGLELLDDFDHKALDKKGKTKQKTVYPTYDEYVDFISNMYSEFESDIFALPKDDSFKSSVNQIAQTFDGKELYSSLQEKASNLLYFIVKNHSFVDGNKRIGAGCFLYFLDRNNALFKQNEPIISNEALASLTLFIASSKSAEAHIVKQFIMSILNRNLENMK